MSDENTVIETAPDVNDVAEPSTVAEVQDQPIEQETEQVAPTTDEISAEDSDNSEQSSSDEPQTVPMDRFREVYFKRREAERQLEELKAANQQTQVDQAQPGQDKPTREQFDYDDDAYFEALTDWKIEQREKASQVRQAQTQQQKQISEFKNKQADYVMKHPEYQQLCDLADRTGVQFSNEMAEVIFQSDKGMQIHHHLLANPDKLDDIMGKSPVQQVRELVNLESNFRQPKSVTKAPPPIKPVSAGSTETTKSQDQLSRMSPQEYYDYQMGLRRAKR